MDQVIGTYRIKPLENGEGLGARFQPGYILESAAAKIHQYAAHFN